MAPSACAALIVASLHDNGFGGQFIEFDAPGSGPVGPAHPCFFGFGPLADPSLSLNIVVNGVLEHYTTTSGNFSIGSGWAVFWTLPSHITLLPGCLGQQLSLTGVLPFLDEVVWFDCAGLAISPPPQPDVAGCTGEIPQAVVGGPATGCTGTL